MLPLYEAKMIHHFNHRFADYRDLPAGSKSTQLPQVPEERLQDPSYEPLPRYWVEEQEVKDRLVLRGRAGEPAERWDKEWLLGWRDICRSTDERTENAGSLRCASDCHPSRTAVPEFAGSSTRSSLSYCD
jgi:hypothetical protein